MTAHNITLQIPDPLFHRRKNRAGQARRPVAEPLLNVLAAAVPARDDLPPDLAALLPTRQ